MNLTGIKIDRIAMTTAAIEQAGGSADAPGVSIFGCQVEIEPNGVTCDFTSQWTAVRDRCRTWSRDDLRRHQTARHYYDFYQRRLGIQPHETPPSAVNLLIRFAIGDGAKRPIPLIHPAVDAGNVAQAENLIPVAVFDADAIEGDMLLDVARFGDSLLPFGYERPQQIYAGRLVLRDQTKVLSEFCYRDGKAQAVTPTTRRLRILACQVPKVPRSKVVATLLRVVNLLENSHHIR
ncbi:MAG: phenylalanine--tRNA ligase beta subunit-related protein [Candidatus Melainabacteria bacterium]|nr:phenylalanine--tRNA ligase beta subunit-related protein [Candidatus Melainabacteria bacterium]